MAVFAKTLINLDTIVKQARIRIPKKGKRKHERYYEIKYSLTGDKTRKFVLKQIAQKDISIHALIINKAGKEIADNPNNFALLIHKLIKNNNQFQHLIIDKHFTNKYQQEQFNKLLLRLSNQKFFIEHLDSEDNPVLALPDFIAGAIRINKIKGKTEFVKIIEKQIISMQEISWSQIKKR